ncbi:CBS domain protein [gamma proteobacterium HdN1]|nr:CBS domain protein [gamma proteobacterium HdN1]
MAVPRTTEEIMTRNVYTCTEADSVSSAHRLMTQKGIRHLPVVSSETGEFVGVITQKELLRHAFGVVASVGIAELERAGENRKIADVMTRDVETIQPQLPLREAGKFFVACKHGCLPVVVDGRLLGILTSADFVKLSVTLLESHT